MRVIVVGGGIGGLAAALHLHAAGIDVVLCEQGEDFTEVGVGINLLPHGVERLAALGLLDPLDRIAVRTEELFYAHRLGHTIARRECGVAAGFAFPQLSVHRGRLQGALVAAARERLAPAALRVGHRVNTLEQDDDGVTVQLLDRAGNDLDPVRGDVLVAADGIHSAVRAGLVPDEGPPRWNGVMLWRGATDWPVFRTGRSMLVQGGTDAKLVVYPVAPGESPQTRLTNWAVCLRTGPDGSPPPERQDWSRPADRDELRGHLDRFHVPDLDHHALVEATAEAFEFPMCDRDPLPRWSHERVTLLGDAAHPMYPMGSNGAGQAVLDAASLVDHLTSHDDPVRALRAYEEERLPLTGEIVRRNRTGGPEGVIDEVERRAPDGFDDLEDVMSTAELEDVLSGYGKLTQGAPAR